jgi:hypothetical protein
VGAQLPKAATGPSYKRLGRRGALPHYKSSLRLAVIEEPQHEVEGLAVIEGSGARPHYKSWLRLAVIEEPQHEVEGLAVIERSGALPHYKS